MPSDEFSRAANPSNLHPSLFDPLNHSYRHIKVYSNFRRLFTQSEGLVDDSLLQVSAVMSP